MGWNERGRRFFRRWLVVLSLASAAAFVGGQSDFLNIDCGKDSEYTYNDGRTGLLYTSDRQYVTTGESHRVASTYQVNPFALYNDLRSFPSGTRNCYTLPVKPDRKHLVRAWFLYGNYDGLDQPPQFELHAGVNHWSSVTITNASQSQMEELLFMAAAKRSMDICLVNTGGGTPFISALELRPLPDELYPQANASQALSLLSRTDDGSTRSLRYPNDPYDRVWMAFNLGEWARLTTESTVETVPSYQPPSDVLKTAVYPATGSTMSFSYSMVTDTAIKETRVHIFLYFAELQQLKANETRAFNITLNGKPWGTFNPVKPAYLKGLTVYNINPENANPLNFELVPTSESTLLPLVNGGEIYMITGMTGVETTRQDVDAIQAIKASYGVQRNWQGDPCSPRSFIWEGLNCSSNGSTSPRIISLNLTSAGLTGEITAAIGNLTQLQILDLSRNSLTGRIPDFLANLAQLRFLDVSGNNLEGSVPKALLDRSVTGALTLKVGGNGNLCNNSTSCESTKKSSSKSIAAIAASIGSVLVLAGVIVAVIAWRRKTKNPGKLQNGKNTRAQNKLRDGSYDMASVDVKSKQFAHADLERITKNFQKQIGRGGFGPVYHGMLDNGMEVAVKVLSESSSQGPKEFQNEALLLTRIHHRRLVSLVGYCNDNNTLALVYEYMAEGSLHDHLRGKSSNVNNNMNWTTRLRISIEAAQGLEYLHNGCKPSIVHRDVKPNNILLNQKFEAKIADFGLSKIFENEANTHVLTKVMGTRGYIDPDYYVTSKLTEKSDVYSFGIILLEMVTGLPAIIVAEDNITLVHLIRKKVDQGNIEEIIDKKLHGEYDINSIWKVVETALSCTLVVPIQRPDISEVLDLLKDCLELEKAKANNHVTRHSTSNPNSITSAGSFALDMTTISNPSAR